LDQGGGKWRAAIRTSSEEMRFLLQPRTNDPSALLAIGRPRLWKDVIHNVITLDAERVLDNLGGSIAIVPTNGLLK
jgi:hypothetical protein